jgi:hypothetical protein
VIVTGAGPQSKVMMPPAATALTTAAEVQLAAVPVPTVRVGWLVSTARAAAGTAACPEGLPGCASFFTGAGDDDGGDDDGGDDDGVAAATVAATGGAAEEEAATEEAGGGVVPLWHALMLSRLSAAARGVRRIRTAG